MTLAPTTCTQCHAVIENLYLCPTCTQNLQTHLDTLTPEFLHTLYLIATKQAAPADTTKTSTTNASSEPISLHILQLWDTLTHTPTNAQTYANNPYDATETVTVIRNIGNAKDIIHGTQNEAYEALQAKLFIQQTIDTMRVPDLCKWYKERFGINLKPGRVYKWASRGKLTPSAVYHPADIYPLLTKKEQRVINTTTPKN